MDLKLIVDRYTTGRHGTQSRVTLTSGGRDICDLHGIECRWADNRPFESCIPSGIYTIMPHHSPKYGDCLTFQCGTVTPWQSDLSISGGTRFACLIHAATYARQLQGCLAVGVKKDDTGDPDTKGPAVWSSRKALDQILEHVTGPIPAYINWSRT